LLFRLQFGLNIIKTPRVIKMTESATHAALHDLPGFYPSVELRHDNKQRSLKLSDQTLSVYRKPEP
jgi:hypothetical protein